MSFINIGDLLIEKYIAIGTEYSSHPDSEDYTKGLPVVKVINPQTGKRSKLYLSEIKKLTGACRI